LITGWAKYYHKEVKNMFKKIRCELLGSLAALALFVGVIGIKPASLFILYQPEAPEHLTDS